MVSAALLAGTAGADPKQAAVHNRQAKAFFEAKQYDQAIGEFKKSYEHEKKALTLFKIASAYYAKADYKTAIEYYQQYLSADPNGPYAAQALEFTTVATKALDEQRAAEEKRKQDETREQKRVAALARVKQAEAHVAAGTFASAGAEYRAAADVGEDPEYLLAAADAYRKQPDDVKAREVLQRYLDRVPMGPKSDEVRARVAELTRAIDEANKRVAEAPRPPATELRVDRVEPAKPPLKRFAGFGVIAGSGMAGFRSSIDFMNGNGPAGGGHGIRSLPSFLVGGRVRVRMSEQLMFDTGLQLHRRRIYLEHCVPCMKVGEIVMSELELPLLLSYALMTGSVRPALVGGAYAAMRLSTRSVDTVGSATNEIKGIDIGLMGGIEAYYTRYGVQILFQYGLVPISREADSPVIGLTFAGGVRF